MQIMYLGFKNTGLLLAFVLLVFALFNANYGLAVVSIALAALAK